MPKRPSITIAATHANVFPLLAGWSRPIGENTPFTATFPELQPSAGADSLPQIGHQALEPGKVVNRPENRAKDLSPVIEMA
jgi:hypothetical protein